MPRFFVNTPFNNTIIISGDDAKHISRSLRMKIGENLTVCDANGNDYLCTISEINNDNILLNVISSYKNISEPNINITLYQAIPKSDKMDFIVQKAVELGVYKIIPVITSRCIARPDKKNKNKKLDRLNKIALSAAQQSGRGIIPSVEDIVSFDNAINEMTKDDLSIIFYESKGKTLKNIIDKNHKNISIMIGAEGGFDIDEINKAISLNINIVNLGPRILRCETAPICAISSIMYATGNLE